MHCATGNQYELVYLVGYVHAGVWRRVGPVQVGAYSAEQSAHERAQAQDAFNRGSIRVLVATSAFGMGVNKADIRWVRCRPSSCQCYTCALVVLGRCSNHIVQPT